MARRSCQGNNCLSFSQSLLPQQCILCTAPAGSDVVCAECYRRLPWLTAVRCPQCALPTGTGKVCGACLSEPPRYDSITAPFEYAWPLAPLVQHYKYAANLALARLLARALADMLDRSADVIIPLPLAPRRLRERGFNQALEIGRLVSRSTAIPLAPHACRRVRESTPQAALPWAERARNIRGAFVCDADLAGMRVAVVDDVMTTGATLNEIARNLRQAGAVEVQGWVVARTLKHD
jgi:ComF family protein